MERAQHKVSFDGNLCHSRTLKIHYYQSRKMKTKFCMKMREKIKYSRLNKIKSRFINDIHSHFTWWFSFFTFFLHLVFLFQCFTIWEIDMRNAEYVKNEKYTYFFPLSRKVSNSTDILQHNALRRCPMEQFVLIKWPPRMEDMALG